MSEPATLTRESDIALTDAKSLASVYRYWRFRLLATSLVGYAIFYFVRTNISVALPTMGKSLHYSKEQLGLVLTVGGVIYGVSKFINGFLGDRANPRYFMAAGLFICAVMNVCFGLSTSLVFLALFWFLNNWAQGMGFPPCAKTMAYWFSPRERSTTFGIWHTGHTMGAALVSVLTGYLIKEWGDWRLCFFVPAALAVGGTIMILISLRNTPESMGLPPVEIYKGEQTHEQLAREIAEAEPYLTVVWNMVLKSPFMWIISIANFLVYTLRYAAVFWGPSLLQEQKHFTPAASGWMQFLFEAAGLCSALFAGYVADHWFGGRAGRVCAIAMALMAVAIYLFWRTPPGHILRASMCYVTMGFMVYIPQMLIAAIAMNLGTKRAAAAAVGLTGILGYASTAISGWGVGYIVDHAGWSSAFIMMIVCALATLVLMALTWNVGAHHQSAASSGFPVEVEN